MGIRANQQYNGRVAGGSHIMESGTGTLGYNVALECEDGETSCVIWLTEKTAESAKRTFVDVLGVNEKDLASHNYIQNQMALDIEGRQVGFPTETNEYNGKTTVKVKYIRKPYVASAAGSPARAIASLFGGKPAPVAKPAANGAKTAITDDDIPF